MSLKTGPGTGFIFNGLIRVTENKALFTSFRCHGGGQLGGQISELNERAITGRRERSEIQMAVRQF